MIERFGSGGPWEQAVGYSRAVRAGSLVFVAGCTGAGETAYAQAVEACQKIVSALGQAGASAADVVQTRMYVTDISQWEEIGRAHAEAFGAAPPVSAMVEVKALIDPGFLVEIEAIAVVS